MKKKILVAVVLLVYMAFGILSLASCGDEEVPELDAFSTAISATVPSTVNGSIKMDTEYGQLKAEYNAVIAEDGSFTVNYSYDKLNDLNTGDADDVTSKIEGTVTYKDGAYSDSAIAAKIPADAIATKLKLNTSKMTYTVSEDGNVLAMTVKAANTKAVLGVEYAADVNVVITKAADKIVSLTLTYTLPEGKVEVVCQYK